MGRLGELAVLFLRLGATAFGGPAAHVAIFEDEIVTRRGWMTRERFVDRLAVAQLLPGPTSTELSMHVGYERAGAAGLFVAGTCFILPAAAMVLAIAWAYARWGALPVLARPLSGMKPVVVAIVAQALWSLGKTALGTRVRWVICVLSAIAAAAGQPEIVVLLAAGAVSLAASRVTLRSAALVAIAGAPAAAGASAASPSVLAVLAAFAKVGALLFGSGYVLFAFLRAELVVSRGWITEAQLLDAAAVGQLTPGPLLTTATFLGFVLGGTKGAVAATVGIFAPAFAFVLAAERVLPHLLEKPWFRAFLDGVGAASVALLGVVLVQLGRAALTTPAAGVLALVSAALLVRYRVNATWLMAAGAALGALGVVS